MKTADGRPKTKRRSLAMGCDHLPAAMEGAEMADADAATTGAALVSPVLAARAYAEILPDIEALPASSVRRVTIDLPRAVSVAMGALPGLMALRPDIASLPQGDVKALDRLEQYALGAWYAQVLALPTTVDGRTLKRQLDEARMLRGRLLVAAEALADRDLLDPTTVGEIRSGKGSLHVANSLVALSALFGASWDAVSSKTAATRAEVHRAAALAPEILAALGAPEKGAPSASVAAARDRRARAYTLLVEAYDSCRRAVVYLRWRERDADRLAPSMFRLVAPRRGAGLDAGPQGPTPAATQPPTTTTTAPRVGEEADREM